MANNNQVREIEERDDDFEDFGGFEAADPVPDMPAAQAQAAASPWAVFNSGNAPGRPDLLCAQNQFPNYLDPSGIAGPGEGAGPDMNLNNGTGNPPDLPHADLLSGQLLGNQARIAENVLDGTLNAGAGASGFHNGPNLISGRLPDIGLGTNENRMFHQVNGLERLAGDMSLEDQASRPLLDHPNNLIDAAAQPVDRGVADPHIMLQDGAVAEIHAGGDQPALNAVEADVAREQRSMVVEAVEEATEGGGARKNALQQRITALTEENSRLEEELRRCREELAAQNSRVQEMETRHGAQLEDVRRAGHDTLAVVVEQYKEQSKAVVLEQQEEARRQVAEVVREQMRAFQDMLHAQHENDEQRKKEDKAKWEREIAQALEQSRQEQENKFQAFLAEEGEKQKKATEQALEEERTASQNRFQEAIVAEVERGRVRLEEARAEASERLSEERRNHETELAVVREEEKRLAQEQMTQLANEERERSREITREAMEASRLESQAYIQEQRQADSRVRQRHLISLDLFLESSRQQIALLMESERHQAPSAEPLSSQLSTTGSASASSTFRNDSDKGASSSGNKDSQGS